MNVENRKEIQLPLSEKEARKLAVGESVSLWGTIFTSRDQAHRLLLEKSPDELPFSLEGSAIYHSGPITRRNGENYEVVAAGPTTSARMNPYQVELLKKYGVRLVLGKGGMDQAVARSFKDLGSAYVALPGGAAVYLARFVRKVVAVHFLKELGPVEAVWQLEVQGLPGVVAMDSRGENLYRRVEEESLQRLKELVG